MSCGFFFPLKIMFDICIDVIFSCRFMNRKYVQHKLVNVFVIVIKMYSMAKICFYDYKEVYIILLREKMWCLLL